MTETRTKDIREQDAEKAQEKRKRPEPAPEHVKALAGESVPFAGLFGVSAMELPIERHAALLGEPRFSHSVNNTQKARMVTELQGTYGNAYVQRVVGRIQTKKDDPIPEEDQDIVGISQRIAEQKGSGQPLALETRSEMEAAFGQDFSDVRVHTDANADKLSRELGAKAFTTGKDIFFKQGAHDPEKSDGKQLLAHELTHVVQQSEAPPASPLGMISPSEPAEMEAAVAGQAVARGDSFSVMKQPQAAVARQAKGTAPKVRKITIPEELAEEEPTTTESDIKDYLNALKSFFSNSAIRYNTACAGFTNTMFQKKPAGSPDIAGAVLKEGVQIVVDKLVGAAGKHIPGIGEAKSIAKAIWDEIEKAKGDAKANKLVDFINNAAGNVVTYLTGRSQDIASNKDAYRRVLRKQAGPPRGTEEQMLQYEMFGLHLRKITRGLKLLPKIDDIKRSLYEGWMRHSTSREARTGFFSPDIVEQGVLFLHYEIDDEKESAELDQRILAGPFAPQVKEGLKATIGETIDTNTLNFMRAVQVEKDRFHRYTIHIGPGGTPRDDPYHYFSRFIKKLPTIKIEEVSTAEEIITD